MFTAGHHWTGKKFAPFHLPIEHSSLFLDSGAFQLFGKYNSYPFTTNDYSHFVRNLQPDFFASLDYPCEPFMREKIGGLSPKDCIDKTIENTINLVDEDMESSILVPVIQGWEIADYLYCVDQMESQGLIKDYMGIGTLCRRAKVSDLLRIIRNIKRELPQRCKLHGFGVKVNLLKYQETYRLLVSCDSAAWVSQVAHGEICIFTGKRLIHIPYRDLGIDGIERLSISVEGYVSYVEYLISKHSNQKLLVEILGNDASKRKYKNGQ